MLDLDLLRDASDVWAPSFPRNTVDARIRQHTVESRTELVDALSAVSGKGPGYVSTYAFPRGHSKDGEIPQIDTLMFDLDVPNSKEYTEGDIGAWKRDLSNLLARVRMVARFLVDSGMDDHWRGSLSGFKGVHLYLDFPAIAPDEGSHNQFKRGLGQYADELISYIESETHVTLADWVDVDSSDLGRLTRHPNTIHTGATAFFDDERYCVPVSLRELTTITPDDYVELTKHPRPVPDDCQRNPSGVAHDIITQYVRTATERDHSPLSRSTGRTGSVSGYTDRENHLIKTKADVAFIMTNKPCVMAFFDREDAFHHGYASHKFEMFVIDELTNKNVPIEVIVDLFRELPGFDEEYTRTRIADVIAYNYQNRFSCETIWADADTFCLGEVCHLYTTH